MNFDEYQQEAAKTAIYPGQGTVEGLAYTVFGLAGEVGEVAQKLKRLFRDGNGWLFTARDGRLTPEFKRRLADEALDCVWYISQLLTELGVSFDEALEDHLEKLAARRERGTLGGSGDDR